MKKMVLCVLVIAVCALLLAGCGAASVSGRYVAENGDAFDFNRHGEVTVTQDGETTESYIYAVNGSDVFVYEPDFDHEAGRETGNILTVSGNTLTDKGGTVFAKTK